MILRLRQVHFPEVSGVVGDDTEHCAWDPGRSVSPDNDSEWKENCYYPRSMLLAEGVRCWMGRRVASCDWIVSFPGRSL